MVKHVILWTLKDELSDSEKADIKKSIKDGLEGLKDKVPGIVEIKVNIEVLPSSNADMMLDSTFESEEALKNYATHPEHVAVADNKVRPYTKLRSCLDYIVQQEIINNSVKYIFNISYDFYNTGGLEYGV